MTSGTKRNSRVAVMAANLMNYGLDFDEARDLIRAFGPAKAPGMAYETASFSEKYGTTFQEAFSAIQTFGNGNAEKLARFATSKGALPQELFSAFPLYQSDGVNEMALAANLGHIRTLDDVMDDKNLLSRKLENIFLVAPKPQAGYAEPWFVGDGLPTQEPPIQESGFEYQMSQGAYEFLLKSGFKKPANLINDQLKDLIEKNSLTVQSYGGTALLSRPGEINPTVSAETEEIESSELLPGTEVPFSYLSPIERQGIEGQLYTSYSTHSERLGEEESSWDRSHRIRIINYFG